MMKIKSGFNFFLIILKIFKIEKNNLFLFKHIKFTFYLFFFKNTKLSKIKI